MYSTLGYVSRHILDFDIYFSELFLSLRNYYKALFSRNECLSLHEQRMGSFLRLQTEAPFPTTYCYVTRIRAAFQWVFSLQENNILPEDVIRILAIF